MFEDEIFLLDINPSNQNELFSIISNRLKAKNIVKETFQEAIINREKNFPTGLNVGKYGVAIPHTDPEHVNKSQISFARLKNPIIFKQMGDNKDVSVNMVFVLTLKEAHEQLSVLQSLMNFIQNKELMEDLETTNSVEFVKDVFTKNIK